MLPVTNYCEIHNEYHFCNYMLSGGRTVENKTKCPKHWHKKEWWITCPTCPDTISAADFADMPKEAPNDNQ